MIIARGEQQVSYPGWENGGHVIKKSCLGALRADVEALGIFKTISTLALFFLLLIISHSQLCCFPSLNLGVPMRQL